MRHYTCSIFGAGGNSRGSAYDSGNAYIMFSSEERKESFKKVRKHIKDSFKQYLSLNINCTNELRYYCNITCYDDISGKKLGQQFKINPKDIK